MDEKRKDRRVDLDVTLELNRIDSEDGVTTLKLVHVEVTDLSKSGIGFKTKQELKPGSIYNAKLQIWTKDIIDVIIKIVRCKREDKLYNYGAIFVGMIDKDALKIDVYRMFFESKEKEELDENDN